MPRPSKAKRNQVVSVPLKKCPVTREEFREFAEALDVKVGDAELTMEPREFKGLTGEVDGTGSLGWSLAEKIQVRVNGVTCRAQLGLNLTLIGSKQKEE